MATRSGEPSWRRCSWPTSSPTVCGRMRTASGASASGTAVRVRGGSPSSGAKSWSMERRYPPSVDPVGLLQRLIRFDTVNPPGNERPAQELLEVVLRDAGFHVELHGRTESRPNLVATLT